MPQPAHGTSLVAALPPLHEALPEVVHALRHEALHAASQTPVLHEMVTATVAVNATMRGTLQPPHNVPCCRCRTDRGWNVGYGGNNGPSRVASHGPGRVAGYGPDVVPGPGARLRRNGSVVCGGGAR